MTCFSLHRITTACQPGLDLMQNESTCGGSGITSLQISRSWPQPQHWLGWPLSTFRAVVTMLGLLRRSQALSFSFVGLNFCRVRCRRDLYAARWFSGQVRLALRSAPRRGGFGSPKDHAPARRSDFRLWMEAGLSWRAEAGSLDPGHCYCSGQGSIAHAKIAEIFPTCTGSDYYVTFFIPMVL